MKKSALFPAILFSLTLATGALAAGGTMDQKAGAAQQDRQAQTGQVKGQLQSGQLQEAASLIGKSVEGQKGERIGQVAGILIDTQSGKARYLTVTAAGAAGAGQDKYAVPWQAVNFRQGTGGEVTLSLDMSADRFKQAPKTTKLSSREDELIIFEYYGLAPYWEVEIVEPPASR